LIDQLRWLLWGILENHGSSKMILPSYNTPTWPLAKLNEWWVYMVDFINNGIDSVSLMNWESEVWEQLLNKFANQIIDNEKNFTDYTRKEEEPDSIWDIIWNVKDTVREETS
jgi:hypothetical protein